MSDQRSLLAVLDRLEDVESRLLGWGVTGVNLSREEVEAAVREALPTADVEAVIQSMLDESLLLKIGAHYRTRTAETLRLLAHLRQWFGRGFDGCVQSVWEGEKLWVDPSEVQSWPEARHLVSDFRFRAQPRAVPRRDRAREDVLSELQADQGIRQALAGLMPDRISRFQERSIQTILAWKNASRDQAAVVTAGTGAGKTYAFYLPVLADLLTGPAASNCPTVLAVYPRNELLKDQLQNAYELCRRVDSLAATNGRKPLRIGALYGDVPQRPQWVTGPYGWQDRSRSGRICPFMRCPECAQPMEWRDLDRQAGHEALYCTKATCGAQVPDGLVALTRESLKQNPPDVLFLSMEMLNRYLQESFNDKVIGGWRHAPRYVLLDEVHTYGGVSGAQNAYVLRRWRQRVWSKGRAVHWVGLSATLKRPEDFFRQLVPIDDRAEVQCVAPEDVELERSGKQYTVVLRGDPTSQAALLGVTIQSLMLLARSCTAVREGRFAEDPRRPAQAPSDWQRTVFGHKVFAFTDTLDVFSRLEGDLTDADSNKHLPWLRATTTADGEAREATLARLDAGQYWRLPERLGRDLGRGLRIQSVSSKWSARDLARADVVVATASLEVGFDDDEVNVVLQHKAPRDWAAYLQRIGRAGRKIEMRPWAVTVLSDYGRDGQAYRNYHEFFEPALRYNPVPVDNTYVLRIQAALATLDLIATESARSGGGTQYGESVQGFLAKLVRGERTPTQASAVCSVIQQLLEDPGGYRQQLERRLSRGRNDPLLGDVLYRSPRSLLYEFLPSVLRQLRGHRRPSEEGKQPFSHYVPATLFKQLDFPEVVLEQPGGAATEELDLALALSEFAPLNASKRFSRQGAGAHAHWVAPGNLLEMAQEACAEQVDAVPEILLDLQDLGEFEPEASSFDSPDGMRLMRPRVLRLREVSEFSDRTRSRLAWQTSILRDSEGQEDSSQAGYRSVPRHAAVAALVESLCFALHRTGEPLTLRRYANRARCTLSASDQEMTANGFAKDQQVDLVFADRGSPAAIGFEFEADAVGLILQAGAFDEPDWFVRGEAAGKWRRSEFYQDYFRSRWDGQVLATGECLNSFALDRLSTLFLALLGTDCLEWELTVAQRVDFYANEGREELVRLLLRMSSFAHDRLDPNATETQPSRLSENLEVLIRNESLRHSLLELARVLHESPVDTEWGKDMEAWASQRAKLAVGATFLSAVGQLLPDMDLGSLAVDVAPGDSGSDAVWVSETTPGGVGTVQQVLDVFNQDEEQFFAHWADAMQPTGQESVALDLETLVGELLREGPVADAAAAFRAAAEESVQAQERSVQGLKVAVEAMGIPWRHGLRVPLLSRMLSPGTTRVMDVWTSRLLGFRRQASALPYLMPDLGVLYRMCTEVDSVDKTQRELGSEEHPWRSTWRVPGMAENEGYRRAWMRLHFSTLLWESATRQMERETSLYNRYRAGVSPDVMALRGALVVPPEVDVESREVVSWWPELQEAFKNSPAEVRLRVGEQGRPSLAVAMAQIAVQQVDYEVTRSFVRPMGVYRDARGWYAVVRVMEFRR